MRVESGTVKLLSVLTVYVRELFVQGQEIPQDAEAEKSRREEVKEAGENFAHVKAVDAKQAQEGEENPGEIVIHRARDEAPLSIALHGGNEKQVYYPTDKKQAQGKKPDNTCNLPAVVKTVSPDKAEYPQQVSQ